MFGVASQTDKNVLGENVADGALILLSTSCLLYTSPSPRD